MSFAKRYRDELAGALDTIDPDQVGRAIEILAQARDNGRLPDHRVERPRRRAARPAGGTQYSDFPHAYRTHRGRSPGGVAHDRLLLHGGRTPAGVVLTAGPLGRYPA